MEPAIPSSALESITDMLRSSVQIQRDNSLWLQIGLILLALTALFTIFSGVLAFRARRAAVRSERSSKTAMLAETRAWLRISVTGQGPVVQTAEGYEMAVEIKLENLGRSPATRICLAVEMAVAADDTALSKIVDQHLTRTRRATPLAIMPLYPGEHIVQRQAALLRAPETSVSERENRSGVLVAAVTYASVGLHDAQTAMVYSLESSSRRSPGAFPSGLNDLVTEIQPIVHAQVVT